MWRLYLLADGQAGESHAHVLLWVACAEPSPRQEKPGRAGETFENQAHMLL